MMNLFVNLPVKDLKRTMNFFTKLGFKFNPQFTDEKAACMIINSESYIMLVVEPFFKNFTDKEICDASQNTEVLVAISMESKNQVNEMIEKVLSMGGTEKREPQDYDFMYQRSFNDLDGHIWEVFWMDPNHIK